jgi:uncharacterized OB-fold protein
VSRLVCPVRLDYEVRAGRELGRFLAALAEGRFIGRRCPACRKVYLPPKGCCPTCGVLTTEDVPVADCGTVTTFCIVNVPFEGQTMKLPYVYASVLLDGADIPFAHLVDGIPAADVKIGMRVRARWAAELRPTLESILSFVPEPTP